MKPTDVLRHEHKIVLMVLDGAEHEARQIGAGLPPDAARIGRMVDFFQNFVDRCHHAKEERCLFPMMRDRSPHAAEGPIDILLVEHQAGRRLIVAVAEVLEAAAAGDRRVYAKLADDLMTYANLMRAHTDKEDNIAFPLADRLLRPMDQDDLGLAFDRIEAEELGPGVHERYHRLAHELAEKVGG
jgi:hemerythrin-like domain-containing protein